MLDIMLDEISAAPVSRAPVVSIKEVTHRYGGALALDGISIDIPGGRMVGIVGPDGVGKSTLMALIVGSKQILQGKVIVLNGDMASARNRRDACPRIAYMPQGLGKNLYFELSVQENVDFMARLFGLSAAQRPIRVKELLDATGLGPLGQCLRPERLRSSWRGPTPMILKSASSSCCRKKNALVTST